MNIEIWKEPIGKYQEDRSKGLVSLNRRYIESFQTELKTTLSAGKLEEANVIQTKIKSLEEEIVQLEKQAEIVRSRPSKVDAPDFLVGKTVGFTRGSDQALYYFSFQEEGKALWLGTKNQAIARTYKPTEKPREFQLWWESRPNDSKYSILVSEDGKSAKVIELFGDGNISDAIIEKTD